MRKIFEHGGLYLFDTSKYVHLQPLSTFSDLRQEVYTPYPFTPSPCVQYPILLQSSPRFFAVQFAYFVSSKYDKITGIPIIIATKIG